MITRYDDARARKVRMVLVADNLFCMVLPALKKVGPEHTELNDVEIWIASIKLTQSLRECPAPEELLEDLVEDASGAEIHSTDAFLVMLMSVVQLAAQRKFIENADDLSLLMMPYCTEHKLYATIMNQMDTKEQQMRMVGKKVDIMTYEMKQVIENDKEGMVNAINAFIESSMLLGAANMRDNLLVLNLVNLQNDHVLDDKILEMYDKMMEQSAQKPNIEVTLGNKNVAQQGSAQINTPMPTDAGNMLQLLNSIKGLTDGNR